MSGQLHDPVTLCPRKNPVLTEWEAELAPDADWTFCRREVSLAPAVIRTPNGTACSLDTIPTFNNVENGMAHAKLYHVSLRRLLIKRTLFSSDKYLASYAWDARKLSCKYIFYTLNC